MPDYNLITRDQIIAAMASTRAARRRRRPLKSEWLVEYANVRYPANKVFQRAAVIAGLTLKPKSTHQVADFLIKRGFTVLYNGNAVSSAKDAMRRFGKNATPFNAPPPNPSAWTPPRATQPAPMKVAPPPPTRKATLELALVAMEEALTAKAAEVGVTPEMDKSFERYQALKANYLMRTAQGFRTKEEQNEANTVLRTALINLIKITV